MGQYQIGPRIGTGGMAEVYLGTQQAIGGFRKLVVMKRLLGWQRSDDAAIESLLDEARIAATINHPSIVTTLDIGLDRGSPYIVLEYLSGEDLRYVLQHLHERDASLPLGVACRIGASIAAALAQAHELVLPDGTRRCIVHRDVTPSNIIVCYSGVTKLVDFGVARVSDADPKTKTGTVKGKFSYLAPEQLSGAPLDGRTDVFQLGIVLWEMVTMLRLFEGKTDHERVNAVLNRPIRRPSELNPSVPPSLDRTIMRALERNPERRHQTARELEDELLEAMASIGGSGGDHSVAKWMQTAFAERHASRLELERRTISEAEASAASGDEDVDVDMEIEVGGEKADALWSRRRLQTGPSLNERVTTANSLRGLAVEASVARPRRSVARYMIPALLVMAAAISWIRFYGPVRGERDEQAGVEPAQGAAKLAEYDVDIRVFPASASIAVDGVVLGNGRYRASFVDDGAVHTVTLTAPDHSTVQRRFHGATTLELSLEPLPLPSEPVASATETDERASVKPEAARITHEARGRRRPTTTTPTRDVAPPVAAATAPTPSPTGSAASPPKASEPVFAPSSDNIDPFKTGN